MYMAYAYLHLYSLNLFKKSLLSWTFSVGKEDPFSREFTIFVNTDELEYKLFLNGEAFFVKQVYH